MLARGIMLFPAVEPGSGPFAGRAHRWSVPEAGISDGERAVAASWYLALMTGVCLELIGAEGPACVEGPLAANPQFTEMLAAIVPGGLSRSPAPPPAPAPAPRSWRCRRPRSRPAASGRIPAAGAASPPTPPAGGRSRARRGRLARRGLRRICL